MIVINLFDSLKQSDSTIVLYHHTISLYIVYMMGGRRLLYFIDDAK